MQAGIIGLGLIGGSMGLALQQAKMFKTILGYDINPLHTQQALSLGLVDECVSFDEIQECDVIFLAIPLEGIIQALQKLDKTSPHTTIIDLGGAKEKIIAAVPPKIRKNFIAAHPMSGTEFYGPKAALKDLFKNKIIIFTDLENSGEFQIACAKEIFLSIGMRIIKMNSKDHDKHIAFISHLPHIISYALANTVLSQENPQTILALVGGGFKDMSRISKSSPIMWNDIFKQNKENVLKSIDLFGKEMLLAEKLIQEENWEELKEWMAKANTLQNFM
ncbi:prephenate dehydrogenase [Helicobacter sp. 12S02232-10]|uniref:prephenate dehydrogenase n=1 Tax=Helicobacter sp. 12S02232-10 TaxID=1476197 RepID=UPI000BA7A180|nr:prephenate dehydrogenase [Helicobacter sp. 12S02232-10]PAF49388.1 prephenate dehydrogenase [Helicobacter sp. 12S02232-10]